jgi:proline iminopeptidase
VLVVRWSVAVVAALAWGALAGWWTPRGPLTAGEGLASVALSLAVGALAGWSTRSRRSALIVPALFALPVELARLRLPGPTVDAPHASPMGFVALVSGRGVHGLVSLLPLVVGAIYGAGSARRGVGLSFARGGPAGVGRGAGVRGGRRWWLVVRRVFAGVAVGFLAVVVVAVALPAATAPIPGGVAELTSVPVGSERLGLLIRGNSRSLPVLLFVPGPPGGSELGAARRYLGGLERQFVVATLDRRGSARSYAALDPASSLTTQRLVADIHAVSEHLRKKFGGRKIYLLAHSGGSLPAALAVQRRPDLYRAYIGTGQAVDLSDQDRIFYDDTLAWARSTGRSAVARQLVTQGPPPYRTFYAYEPIVNNLNAVYPYDSADPAAHDASALGGIGARELTFLERLHVLASFVDAYHVLYPRMQDIDLRVDARRFAVPVYFLQGAHEMRGMAELFAQWYRAGRGAVQAPHHRRTVGPLATVRAAGTAGGGDDAGAVGDG